MTRISEKQEICDVGCDKNIVVLNYYNNSSYGYCGDVYYTFSFPKFGQEDAFVMRDSMRDALAQSLASRYIRLELPNTKPKKKDDFIYIIFTVEAPRLYGNKIGIHFDTKCLRDFGYTPSELMELVNNSVWKYRYHEMSGITLSLVK